MFTYRVSIAAISVCWLAAAGIPLAQNVRDDGNTKVVQSRDFLVSTLPIRKQVSGPPPVPGQYAARAYEGVADVAVTGCALKLSTSSSNFTGIDGAATSVKSYNVSMKDIQLPVTVVNPGVYTSLLVKVASRTSQTEEVTGNAALGAGKYVSDVGEISIPVKDQPTGDRLADALGVVVKACQ